MRPVKIFGRELIDENSISQIMNCFGDEDIAVLTADAHYGYGHPIGGAVAYKRHISLSGVGFDIACGNKAVRTDVRASDVKIAAVMDEIFRRISFGVGRANNEPVEHPVIEKIRQAEFRPQGSMWQMAQNQLGTVGSGNHFVDLFSDEEGFLWVGVHFGSRGFGHKTTTGFIALSKGLKFGDKATFDSRPAVNSAILMKGEHSVDELWNEFQSRMVKTYPALSAIKKPSVSASRPGIEVEEAIYILENAMEMSGVGGTKMQVRLALDSLRSLLPQESKEANGEVKCGDCGTVSERTFCPKCGAVMPESKEEER